MASICRDVIIDAEPEHVWAALRDWGAVHTCLAPGFLTDCRLADGDRIITFFNGMTLRERRVAVDDDQRRLVWTVIDETFAHHNGAAQVVSQEDGRARFVWTTDVLPDELEDTLTEMKEHGLSVIKTTLEQSAATPPGQTAAGTGP